MLILITKRTYKAVDTWRSLYDHSCLLSLNIAQLLSLGTSTTLCYEDWQLSMHMIFSTKYKHITLSVYLF